MAIKGQPFTFKVVPLIVLEQIVAGKPVWIGKLLVELLNG